MGLFQWLFKRKAKIEHSDDKETNLKVKTVSPSIEYAKWGEEFLLNFKKGWDRGIEKTEKALASAPAIGERYWVILGESHDLYSGEIAVRTWQNDFDDRFLCVFSILYQSREKALRAKLLSIKEKREKR